MSATREVATAAQPTQAVAAASLSQELTQLTPEIAKVLPPQVSLDKFMRVVNTALVMTPSLRECDRRSLFTAAVKAATDGLLPDGREGAFVPFKNQVQWMPMVAGIIKKVRNSGELKSLSSNVVRTADVFRYWIDDDGEHIQHEPNLGADPGPVTCAYAVAKTVNGGVYTEVMTLKQIEQVKNVSRAKDSSEGPWKKWPDEMARKSVIRRLAKRLPMSTDLETTIQRDDELYDLPKPKDGERATTGAAGLRSLLGVGEKPAQAERQPYGIDSALRAIADCGDLDELTEIWDDVIADFQAADAEIPVNVEAAYNDRAELLRQSAGN